MVVFAERIFKEKKLGVKSISRYNLLTFVRAVVTLKQKHKLHRSIHFTYTASTKQKWFPLITVVGVTEAKKATILRQAQLFTFVLTVIRVEVRVAVALGGASTKTEKSATEGEGVSSSQSSLEVS